MDKPVNPMIPRGTQSQSMVGKKRRKNKPFFLWNTSVTRSTGSNQLFATENIYLKSSFMNDSSLGIQPALGIGRSSMSRFGGEYRRSQATAGSLRAVCLRSVEDCFGINTLSSLSLVNSNEIRFQKGQYLSSFTKNMFSFMSRQTSVESQFVFDERNVSWPMFSENQGLLIDEFSCDLCYHYSSYNLPVYPISLFASQIGSNRDLAHTTFGEYSPGPSNPVFTGDQQHISTEKPDVTDLRGSQLSHPFQHQTKANRKHLWIAMVKIKAVEADVAVNKSISSSC
ncbi:hypothetical protein TorRG33x02_271380 [Trema orientale]|uniref:Uncharacterized protein n=1 Tax=Trema orientale TaxID=63057 RepID=A0A2P5CW13_TREOI|nr:hypothetical protein TorRG33x02_271380 [Trema orientale]